MTATLDLRGVDEFDRMLQELPKAVANKLGDAALRAGGRVIAAEARRRAPKRLKNKITVGGTGEPPPNAQTRVVAVGLRKSEHSRVAHLVEFGTAPHRITPKRKGKLLVFEVGGRTVFTTAVDHPGAQPHPFLRPAGDTKAQEAIDRIGENLGQGIEREAAKMGKVVR